MVLAEYIRHNDQLLLDGRKDLLSLYEDDLLPLTSFAEFFDVTGESLIWD